MSGSVLAALLSALLLFSPGTARAVAHVLAENGVAIPANVVRILDTLPADPVRDSLRREDENAAVAMSETDATPKDEPEPVSPNWVATLSVSVSLPSPSYRVVSTPRVREYTFGVPVSASRSSISPRAPPV